jgi:hypothetical protein
MVLQIGSQTRGAQWEAHQVLAGLVDREGSFYGQVPAPVQLLHGSVDFGVRCQTTGWAPWGMGCSVSATIWDGRNG